MKVGKYSFANEEKLNRAIHGTVMSGGTAQGGVGEDAKPADLLAEYDRLGGLILFEGKYRVKTGSFYDFKAKKAVAKPKPILLFNVNGETVEVPAGKELPIEVQAAEAAGAKKAKKTKAKVEAAEKSKASKKKKATKKAKDEEDEEGEEDADTDASDEDTEEEA